MTPVLATIVALTNVMGTVEIDTRGARVTSYVPVGGNEVDTYKKIAEIPASVLSDVY